jgi:hypothetical protein
MSMARTTAPTEAELHRKKRRIEARENDKKIEAELKSIASQTNQLLEDAAHKLNIDLQQLTSRFLATTSAIHEVKPTAWNGLVAKKAIEWAEMKGVSTSA